MAERRMFAKTIIDSDAFIDMPLSTQALYFHIGISAQDKGIVKNLFSTAKCIGASKDDILELLDKEFIVPILPEKDTFRIVHWYENNGIGETAKKRNNYAYRQWRACVIARDKVCQLCGSKENLIAHHIKEFALYPLERLNINNGVTLCESCHKSLHKEKRNNG